MSTVYLLCLGAVGVALLAAVIEAVLAVSGKPKWAAQRHSLSLVETVERRKEQLPFVGAERRLAPEAYPEAEEILARRAA